MANYKALRTVFGFFALLGIACCLFLLYLVYLTAKLSLLIAVGCGIIYVWASARRWWEFRKKEKGIYPSKQTRS